MKSPIEALKDLQGLKVWALPGTAARVMEAAKAGVVSTPAVRSHEVISAGTVDAFVGVSLQDTRAFNTMGYAKSITDVPGKLNAPSFSLFINKAKWQSLSAADRDAITKLSGEAFAKRISAIDDAEKAAAAEARKLNITFIKASPQFTADLKKVAQPLEDEWLANAKAANVDGKAALQFYRDQVKQLDK